MSDDTRTMRERMLAGAPYIADDPDLERESLAARDLCHRINELVPSAKQERRHLLIELLGAVGEDTEIRAPFRCDYGYQTTIGAHTFINFGLMCLDVARITIGDHVQIGPNVQLLTPTHPLDPDLRRQEWEGAQPITIADNVWLGGGVIVCPGVTIGENTVVGAGAVVVTDLPPDVVAVGSPARVVKRLTEEPGDVGNRTSLPLIQPGR